MLIPFMGRIIWQPFETTGEYNRDGTPERCSNGDGGATHRPAAQHVAHGICRQLLGHFERLDCAKALSQLGFDILRVHSRLVSLMERAKQSRKRDIEPEKHTGQARSGWDSSRFADRLVRALKSAGKPDAEIARLSGMTPQTFNGYKLRGSEPSAARAFAMADALGVNPLWLIKGEGQQSDRDSADVDWVSLPRYDLARFEPEGFPEPSEIMKVRRDWFSRALRLNDRMWLTELPSDAMPEIGREGDTVLCEFTDPPLADGGVYLFLMGQRPIVRKVQLRPDGMVLKASDPTVDPIVITEDQVDGPAPVGRVRASINVKPV